MLCTPLGSGAANSWKLRLVVLAGVVLAGVLLALVWGRSARAQESSPLLVGLPPDVAAIGEAIAAGDVSSLSATLGGADGNVVRTAYPGDGEPVSVRVATADLSSFMAPGAFRLEATWRPNVRPHALIFVASGRAADGTTLALALTVETVNGRAAVVAYGRILDLSRTLDQFAGQGVLRTPDSPLPPSLGNSASIPPGTLTGFWLLGSILVAAGFATLLGHRPFEQRGGIGR